jgi:uncharacterized protein
MLELFLKLKHVIPDDYVKTVYDISWADIKLSGIKTVFIDLDNTLIPYDVSIPNQAIEQLISSIQSFGLQVIIVSNNRGSRVATFSQMVGLDYISSAKKPTQIGFRKAEKRLGLHRGDQILLVGDQIMTDVLGGKRRGYKVILVDPINLASEKWFTKMNRRLEKKVIQRIKREDFESYQRLHLHEKG